MSAAELATISRALAALRQAWLQPTRASEVLVPDLCGDIYRAVAVVDQALESIKQRVEVTP